MRILLAVLLLSACVSPHPAGVKDGASSLLQPSRQRKHRAPQPAVLPAVPRTQGSSIESD